MNNNHIHNNKAFLKGDILIRFQNTNPNKRHGYKLYINLDTYDVSEVTGLCEGDINVLKTIINEGYANVSKISKMYRDCGEFAKNTKSKKSVENAITRLRKKISDEGGFNPYQLFNHSKGIYIKVEKSIKCDTIEYVKQENVINPCTVTFYSKTLSYSIQIEDEAPANIRPSTEKHKHVIVTRFHSILKKLRDENKTYISSQDLFKIISDRSYAYDKDYNSSAVSSTGTQIRTYLFD